MRRFKKTVPMLMFFSVLLVSQSWAQERQARFIHDIICPLIEIRGPFVTSDLRKTLAFTASMGGFEPTRYTWSVAGGKIVSGQGTPSIKVRIDKRLRLDAGETVITRLTVRGLPDGGS